MATSFMLKRERGHRGRVETLVFLGFGLKSKAGPVCAVKCRSGDVLRGQPSSQYEKLGRGAKPVPEDIGFSVQRRISTPRLKPRDPMNLSVNTS